MSKGELWRTRVPTDNRIPAESALCPVCKKYGKGPLIYSDGAVQYRHRIRRTEAEKAKVRERATKGGFGSSIDTSKFTYCRIPPPEKEKP